MYAGTQASLGTDSLAVGYSVRQEPQKGTLGREHPTARKPVSGRCIRCLSTLVASVLCHAVDEQQVVGAPRSGTHWNTVALSVVGDGDGPRERQNPSFGDRRRSKGRAGHAGDGRG